MNRATTSIASQARPSPMRVLTAWLFRERAVRGPAAIELDVVDQQVARETTAVARATDESVSLEHRLQKVRQMTAAALTDSVSPGVIDEQEAAAIARELINTSVAAHKHTVKLEALT